VSELAELRERVTRLEERMDNVQNLARRTDREVSSWREVLRNHTNVLNGMSERLDHLGRRLDDTVTEMREGFAKVDQAFAKVDQAFATVEANFTMVRAGMGRIEGLLTSALGKAEDHSD
jgi:acyl carrier protein phosphodiesterase